MPERPPGYPAEWESDVLLADGVVIRIRPVVPEDADAIVAFHEHLSPETVYFRFFSPKPQLAPPMVERVTHVDYRDRMTLVAELDDELVAFAGYDRVASTDEAEVAFVVADEHQGRGVGTHLLEHLAAIARSQGITRFVADTLANNRRMLDVFSAMGFENERYLDSGVVHVAFDIEPTERTEAALEDRERRAEARSVARLLWPRSIAVVGAGRERGGIGHELFRNLLEGEFNGPVYPVNPTAKTVASVRAFSTVLEVPDEVDLAVVAVPAAMVLGVVEQCAQKGVRSVVVVTAGFAETGPEGAAVEREIVELARRHGMRMVGPNCMGIANTHPDVRMHATFAPITPLPGRVGFLSQSGALGIAILERASRVGLGISSFVSVGNKADVSGNDLLQYWENDDATDVILLYLESFGNPRKFARLARRVSRVKPIVAVKSGRSTSGVRAASSHTAAAATPDVAVDALFHQSGVLRVDTLGELFDVAQVLATQPLPTGRRVAIVGNSGGPGILAADACEGAGLEVPELSEATQAELGRFLPPGAALSNPVDLVASATPEHYERAIGAVLADDGIDALIVVYTPALATIAGTEVPEAAVRAAQGSDKPVVANVLARRTSTDTELLGVEGLSRRVPSFAAPDTAARALSRIAGYAEWRRRDFGAVPALADVDVEAARLTVTRALESADEARLDPVDTAGLLRCYGIDVVETVRAATADEAAAAAERLGFPVVVKAGAAELAHKTDVGGVRLGLASAEEVRAAVTEMQAVLGGEVVVQPMAEPGVETIVGVLHDPLFGPLVMFGLGGITTELMGDHAFHLVPLTDRDAHDLVRSLRGTPLLFGYRGAPKADVDALEDVLVRVGRLADDLAEVAEMDLNPVIVSERGALVVDAKVRLTRAEPPEPAVRRLRRPR